MDTTLLNSLDDFHKWRDALPANQDLRDDMPTHYPCIVASSTHDISHSSWWAVDYAFIYLQDFSPE